MIALVKTLRALMAEKHLSPEKASHFIGCSTNSVIRWLRNQNPPSQVYRRMIEEGMAKIREAYPELEESTYDLAIRARTLWRKIKGNMTLRERAELHDIHASKGTEAYIKRLEELVTKYGKE